MLIINTLIAGSVAVAGVRTYLRRQQQPKTAAWLVPVAAGAGGQETSEVSASIEEVDGAVDDPSARLQHYLNVSSLSLLMSVSGTLLYPPLNLASVPFTLYTTVPMIERAYEGLTVENRLNGATFGSVLILGALAAERTFAGGLLNWIYNYSALASYRLRQRFSDLFTEVGQNYRNLFTQLMGGNPEKVWVRTNGVEIHRPFDELRQGDVVVVKAGEIVPVAGPVVDGSGEITTLTAGQAFQVASGDSVPRTSLVLSGQIYVQAEQISAQEERS